LNSISGNSSQNLMKASFFFIALLNHFNFTLLLVQ
jgi:hypothetical protein